MRRILAGLLIAGVMATAGCAGEKQSPPAAQEPTPTTAATTGAPDPSSAATTEPTEAPVADVLKFTAKTVDGKNFDGATLAGKPAVLWFWAAWCPRCRAAADDVAAIQRDFDGKVQIVGVAGLGSGQDSMKRFVADTGIGGFPSLADDAGKVWQRFGVTSQEYYVLIDANGKIVHEGPLTSDQLRSKVAALAA